MLVDRLLIAQQVAELSPFCHHLIAWCVGKTEKTWLNQLVQRKMQVTITFSYCIPPQPNINLCWVMFVTVS